MSDGTPFLRVTADRIGAPGSPARMPFRATDAANWSSIIRIGAKMAVIRRRIARRAVSRHTQRAGRVPYGESQLKVLDRKLARTALDDKRARKLMMVAGISSIVATAVLASIGDISRFESPEKLASYLGLTPRVRQSGNRPAFHGKISKHGNATARTMLIEAAWVTASVALSHPHRGMSLVDKQEIERPRVASSSQTPSTNTNHRGQHPFPNK